MTIEIQRMSFASLLALSACVETKLIGETLGTDATSSTDATASETSLSGATSESTSTDDSTSTAQTSAGSSDSTGGGVAGEWTGLYSTGFGNAFIIPCGEEDSVYLYGDVPGFEICDGDQEGAQIWIRVAGTRIGGRFGDEIQDAVLLEGPCLAGSCEAEATFSECTDFESLCFPADVQCDPLAQDCRFGSKCSLAATDETFTCTPEGAVPEGEACTRVDALDDCALGLLCVADEIGADGPGFCRGWCFESMDCANPDSTCTPVALEIGVCIPG